MPALTRDMLQCLLDFCLTCSHSSQAPLLLHRPWPVQVGVVPSGDENWILDAGYWMHSRGVGCKHELHPKFCLHSLRMARCAVEVAEQDRVRAVAEGRNPDNGGRPNSIPRWNCIRVSRGHLLPVCFRRPPSRRPSRRAHCPCICANQLTGGVSLGPSTVPLSLPVHR